MKGLCVFGRRRCSMRLRPIFSFLALPKFAFVAALIAAVAALLNSSFAADSTAAVKIRRVDLGFKNHFKVGSWTPIRIQTDDAATGEKEQVEVTVPDSDGVPTTASAPLTIAAGGHGRVATVYTKVGRIGSAIQ